MLYKNTRPTIIYLLGTMKADPGATLEIPDEHFKKSKAMRMLLDAKVLIPVSEPAAPPPAAVETPPPPALIDAPKEPTARQVKAREKQIATIKQANAAMLLGLADKFREDSELMQAIEARAMELYETHTTPTSPPPEHDKTSPTEPPPAS